MSHNHRVGGFRSTKNEGHRAKSTVPLKAYAFTLAATAATAAGKQNDGNDDEPKSAVVKQIAEAVIHNRSSKKITEMAIRLPLCYHIMTNEEKGARIWSKAGKRKKIASNVTERNISENKVENIAQNSKKV